MRAELRNAPRRTTPGEVQAKINENAHRQTALLGNAEIDPVIKREAMAQLKEEQTALYKKRNLLRAQA